MCRNIRCLVAAAAIVAMTGFARAGTINIVSGSFGGYDLSSASSNWAAAHFAVLNANFHGNTAQLSNVDNSNITALAAALSNADVYVLGTGSSSLTAAESSLLGSFLQNGGGIVNAFNNGFSWTSQLVGNLGSTTGRNHFGGVSLQSGSPLGAGAGGTVTAGTSTSNSFGIDVSGSAISNTGGIVALQTNGTSDAFAATWDLASGGRIVTFGDEEIFKSQGSGGDNRWNGTHRAYLLNAIDFASQGSAAVPEPSSWLGLAAFCVAVSARRLRRRQTQQDDSV